VASIVSFCVEVSIFLISMYNVKILINLSLRYYFFYELQEKDFFDKKEKQIITSKFDITHDKIIFIYFI
jgi:hypothetical protein